MASVTATTRLERQAEGPGVLGEPKPIKGLFASRIARLILLGNLLALGILTAGALVLAELRAQLIQAKIESLATQGELVANVLAEAATVGEPQPALIEERARQVLQRLLLPRATRVRLFRPDGGLIADSNLLADRVDERRLPDLRENRPGAAGAAATAGGFRLLPWRPERTLTDERARAAQGYIVAGQRISEQGERVVSVSLPIQRVQAVVGVLTLEAGDVDDILMAERRAMLPFVLASAAVILLSSVMLALGIARPLRRLADAADRLRRTGATRLVLPEVSRRKDEIGDLGQALERMTAALADRIDSNERFAADVAHEIKNPLTSIRSAVETARTVQDADSRARMLGIIAADVGRLDRLITDIARASRLEAETARGAAERVDLAQLLAEITDIYTATRAPNDPVVTFKGPPPSDCIVAGQPGPLGQVFRNLIDNAKSFSPPGGAVTIAVESVRRREGRIVRATVSDQGPGIPPANLETIFERFYTDRPKGAAFGGNSGLGLSIARQIVDAHKGRIHAENIPGLEEGQSLGARLIVELPAEV